MTTVGGNTNTGGGDFVGRDRNQIITNQDLMIQVELIRAQIGRMESAILTINTTRDRLWFAIIGIVLVVTLFFYTMDKQSTNLYQDLQSLERKVELLERRVNLVQ